MSTTVTKKTAAPKKPAKKPAVKPAKKPSKPKPGPEETPAAAPAETPEAEPTTTKSSKEVLAERRARKAELAAMSPAQKAANKILGAMAKAGARKPYSGIIPGWVSSGCYLVDLVASLGAGLPFSKFIHIFGKKHTGKEQPLSCRIATPDGWKTMGDMRVGTQILNTYGGWSRVTAIHPQGVKPVWEVTFSDGFSTRCGDDHLWTVMRIGTRKPLVKKLSEFRDDLRTGSGERKWHIPITEPVHYPQPLEPLPLDPYLLGLLLGNGGFTQGYPTFSSGDGALVHAVRLRLPDGIEMMQRASGIDYGLVHGRDRFDLKNLQPNPLTQALQGLGLMGKHTRDKHVPSQFLRAPVEDRLALLQGLLDTDGYCDGGRTVELVTASSQLAADVIELAQSLGGLGNFVKSKWVKGVEYKRLRLKLPEAMSPFRLERKVKTLSPAQARPPYRSIESVEYVGEEECQCITVDAVDQHYLTDHYIVTHNTYLAIQIAISVLAAGGLVFWHNQEDGWTNEFAKLCGLDVDHPNFFLLPPELHQVCFDGITASIKELEGDDTPVLFVVDSLGGGCTVDRDQRKVAGKKVKKDGKEETTGARKVGDLAQVTKDFVNKTVPYLVHTMAMVVVTNHTYLDINAYTGPGIPKPEVPVGGGALPFRSVIELKTSNPVTETQKDKLLYGKVKITSVKSKLIPKGLHCTVPIYFKQRKNRFCGLDDAMACIHYLVKQGVWYKNHDGKYVTHVQVDTDEKGKPVYYTNSLNAIRDFMVDQESRDFYKEVKRVVELQFRKQFGFD